MSGLGKNLVAGIHRSAQSILSTIFAAALVAAVAVPAVAAAATVTAPFPRIGVWWPASDSQPVADRAMGDWAALGNADAHHIGEMRAANPDIIVLNSTNARELNYILGNYNHPWNAEVRSAATEWILTQNGSKLTAGVTISQTNLPVGDTSKFAVGEMALVEHELVHITAIGSGSLTVERGQVTPAAAHASGVRIASVVTNWPGAITYDLTTNCPKVDVGYGLETWGTWNARRGTNMTKNADWDGLLIDCLECNPSWMVANGNNRSIDQNRDNIAVTDGYAAFNSAWNAGGIAYGNALRAALGAGVPIVGNGNLRNYNMSGNIFEEFPTADITLTRWNKVFVGPWDAPWASYPEWMANAQDPNVTLIQTYGAQTNYKLMRLGLTTTLMDDGFYSYAIGSNGHATRGIWNYDEYDNAGKGKGYLGQPTGAARTVSGAVRRRDYDNGIVLVNPGDTAVTVSLGGTFKKIDGTQDRTVNNGASVTAVTIQPKDGIVLLKPAPVPPAAPTGTFALAADEVAAPEVAYTASVTGATEMRIDPGTGAFSAWSPYAGSGTVALDGFGTKTVKAEFRNAGGALALSDTVVYAEPVPDTVAPKTSSDATSQYFGIATIHLTATDEGGPVARTYYILDGGAQTEGNVVSVATTGTHALEYWSEDAAGNVEDPHATASFTVDPPQTTSVTVKSNRKAVGVGRRATLSGLLTPGLVGDTCILEYRKGSSTRWIRVSVRKVVSTTGAWSSYSVRPRTRGIYRYRVRFLGDSGRTRSISRTCSVYVR